MLRKKGMSQVLWIVISIIVLLIVATVLAHIVSKGLTKYSENSDKNLDISTDAIGCNIKCGSYCSAGYSTTEATNLVKCGNKDGCDIADINPDFSGCLCACSSSSSGGDDDDDPEPDTCTDDSDCSYDTQFCCDSLCSTDACNGNMWTNAIYIDDTLYGCGAAKTYLFCFIGPNVWDDSTTEYMLMSLPIVVVHSDGTTESTNEITGDILLNGKGGDGTIIKDLPSNMHLYVDDTSKDYLYIPAIALSGPLGTDVILLNQDSINLIVGKDPQLKPAYQGDIQIQFT